jgi:prepilin-type N-terminal cleavage/methylation domain-containing protein
MKHVRNAFTLIELLVVIGVIAVTAGVLGLALGRGNSGTALQAAQGTTSAMIAGARAEAASSLLNAAVLINVTPSSEGFMRELRVATTTGGGIWIDTGSVNELPAGIRFVPDNIAFSSNVDFTGSNPAWVANYYSSSFNGGPYNIKDVDGVTNISSDDYRVIAQFTPRGTTVPIASPGGTINRIVLSPAESVANDKIVFSNAAALRGMTISSYGITTIINEPAAF